MFVFAKTYKLFVAEIRKVETQQAMTTMTFTLLNKFGHGFLIKLRLEKICFNNFRWEPQNLYSYIVTSQMHET